MPDKINLTEKFTKFSDQWSPKIIGELNDFHLKVAKIQGEFIWHKHDDTDELFFVAEGSLLMKFRDKYVRVEKGEIIIVPAGVEHLPVADEETQIMMIEKKGTLNTGDGDANARTVADLEVI